MRHLVVARSPKHEKLLGAYYADFDQVADEEVIELLKRFPVRKLVDAKQPAA